MSAKSEAILEAIRKEVPPHEIVNAFRPLGVDDFFSLCNEIKKELSEQKYPFYLSLACLMVEGSQLQPILDQGSDLLLEELRERASKEAISHLLFLYTIESEKKFIEYQTQKAQFLESIYALSPSSIKESTLEELGNQAQGLRQNLLNEEKRVERLISLAFHIGEAMMVDCFSHFRLLLREELSTPLDSLLEKKLRELFSTDDGIPLQDHDPATEGLITLGLVFAKDFWELGLLPDIADASLLTQDDATKAVGRLSRLGLNKIGDLRSRGLYSIPLLRQWIQSHIEEL